MNQILFLTDDRQLAILPLEIQWNESFKGNLFDGIKTEFPKVILFDDWLTNLASNTIVEVELKTATLSLSKRLYFVDRLYQKIKENKHNFHLKCKELATLRILNELDMQLLTIYIGNDFSNEFLKKVGVKGVFIEGKLISLV